MRKSINPSLIIILTIILTLISFSWNQPFQVFTNGACRFGKPTEGCMAYFPKFNILPFLGNLLPRVVILFPILSFIDKKGCLTKKNIIFGFIGLLVITLTVYFGSIYYQQYISNQISQEPAQKQETTTITNQQKLVTNNETANWKTYTSTKWGFEFKYPKDWTIVKERDNGVVIIENDKGYGTPEVEFYVFEASPDKITLRNKIGSYPVNEEVHVPLSNPAGGRSYDIYKRLEDKNVDNYTTLRYTIDLGYKDVGVSDVYEVSILKDTKIIMVRMIFNPLVNNKFESKVDFVDKILSTFKFLD